jgi:hypothetical protein
MIFLFFSFFLFGLYFYDKVKSISKTVIIVFNLYTFLIVFSTEVLSYLKCFNYSFLNTFWALIFIFSVVLSRNKLASLKRFELKGSFAKYIKSIDYAYLGLFTLCIILVIQSYVFPPNNWDSMTYHLGRLPHWIENESVFHYRTAIYRQIYQPPLSEWIMCQELILFGSDRFLNATQLIFSFGIIAILCQFVKLFNVDKNGKKILILSVLLIPELILQSTSTQNDLILSFYLLGIVYGIAELYQSLNLYNFISVSLFTSFAFLTKGTSFIFVPFIFFIGFIILYSKYKFELLKNIKSIFAFFLVVLVIPFGHFYRNLMLSNDVFGNPSESYFNENINPNTIICGVSKNIGLHFGVPKFSELTNQFVEKIHLVLNVNISDVNNNFNGIKFHLNEWQHSEDDASNFFHIFLFLFATLVLIVKWKKVCNSFKIFHLTGFILFLVFSIVLKWQPWHSRLQLPIFVILTISSILILYSIILKKRHKITHFLMLLFLVYGLIIIFQNPTKKINSISILSENRFEKQFVYNKSELKDYAYIGELLTKHTIGWEVHEDTWEYPLYCFQNRFKLYRTIKSVNVHNPSNHLNQFTKFDFIITQKNAPSIKGLTLFKKLDFFTIYKVK